MACPDDRVDREDQDMPAIGPQVRVIRTKEETAGKKQQIWEKKVEKAAAEMSSQF